MWNKERKKFSQSSAYYSFIVYEQRDKQGVIAFSLAVSA